MSIAQALVLAPDKRLDGLRLRPAKVVNPVDRRAADALSPERILAGRALEDAIKFLGLDDKEACELMVDVDGKPLDKGLLSHWKSGERRLHLDRIINTKIHGPFVIALARLTASCAVKTTVSYAEVRA